MSAKSYCGFADLVQQQRLGRDFKIAICRRVSSRVAVIAPHGGRIEHGTSELARAIAGDDFNLYSLEGVKPSGNYDPLHLTSHLFDEPECLALLASCSVVVAVHGCKGTEEKVLLGGLDRDLKFQLAEALTCAGVAQETEGHTYPATDPNNVCNRGALRKGVQLEITGPLRRSTSAASLVSAVRSVLRRYDAA